ncbi:sensor histidine kinase [Pseudoroseicyclus sp. H15]
MRLLILDDDAADRKLVRRALAQSDVADEVIEATGIADARANVGPDIALAFVDFFLPGCDGLTVMQDMAKRWPDTPVIIMTGLGDERIAAEAIKQGAVDYLPKREITPRTLRRVVERALDLAAMRRRLAAKKKELETFAHALAHDLKAPARLSAYLARAMQEDLAAGATDSLVEDASRMASLCDRMVALIDTLALHVAVDTPVKEAPVPLGEALSGALANLTLDIGEAGARITAEPLPTAMGDETQYIQLFQNLVGNALKYSGPRPPRITVSAEVPEQGWPVISVSDEGIGIAEEDAERIFDSFTRLHGQEEIPGSGIGLATCRKIVERIGGRIWCRSVPGAGATFSFTLPPAPREAAEQAGRSNAA